MATNKKTPAKGSTTKKRVQKKKGPGQKPPMQRVLVMGPTGKTRLEWRPW